MQDKAMSWDKELNSPYRHFTVLTFVNSHIGARRKTPPTRETINRANVFAVSEITSDSGGRGLNMRSECLEITAIPGSRQQMYLIF
jgi:hypothetical protein